MDINQLVNRVYEEITNKLKQQEEQKKSVCVISKNRAQDLDRIIRDRYEIVYFSNEIEEKEFEKIIIPNLPISMMANLANGLSTTCEEAFILSALLKGNKVSVLREGVEYYAYKHSSPALLYKVYEEYEKKLRGFGIAFEHRYESIEESKYCSDVELVAPLNETYRLSKKVISESDLQKLYIQNIKEITVEKKSIITPLARDFIRTHQLKITESGKVE